MLPQKNRVERGTKGFIFMFGYFGTPPKNQDTKMIVKIFSGLPETPQKSIMPIKAQKFYQLIDGSIKLSVDAENEPHKIFQTPKNASLLVDFHLPSRRKNL